MSQRNPDHSAAVYVSIVAGLFLICLVGALALPPEISLNRNLGWIAAIGFFVGIPWLVRTAHRSRITEAVLARGGVLIKIRCLPFWRQPFSSETFFLGLKHEVQFEDLDGLLHVEYCLSDFFHGVRWL